MPELTFNALTNQTGTIYSDGVNTWPAARITATGQSVFPPDAVLQCWMTNSYGIRRLYLYFDTSALPGDTVVRVARLVLTFAIVYKGETRQNMVQAYRHAYRTPLGSYTAENFAAPVFLGLPDNDLFDVRNLIPGQTREYLVQPGGVQFGPGAATRYVLRMKREAASDSDPAQALTGVQLANCGSPTPPQLYVEYDSGPPPGVPLGQAGEPLATERGAGLLRLDRPLEGIAEVVEAIRELGIQSQMLPRWRGRFLRATDADGMQPGPAPLDWWVVLETSALYVQLGVATKTLSTGGRQRLAVPVTLEDW